MKRLHLADRIYPQRNTNLAINQKCTPSAALEICARIFAFNDKEFRATFPKVDGDCLKIKAEIEDLWLQAIGLGRQCVALLFMMYMSVPSWNFQQHEIMIRRYCARNFTGTLLCRNVDLS